MHMKRIITILLIGIIAFGLHSCSDSFFDRFPSDSMQVETYLTNDAEVENVLYDVYYQLRSVTQNIIYLNDIGTDVAYNRKTNNSMDHINLNESNITETFGISSTIWSGCFNIINRSNYVLESLGNVADEPKRKQFEGEAKFFRAYAYFQLVRLFGNVPISTAVIKDYTTLYSFPRQSVDEVYSQIQKDLTDAIAGLPDSYTVESLKGRATRIAALTMLGEVYMTRSDFETAKTYLKSVIDFANTNPSILGLETNVEDIYDSRNANGKEIILAAQFNYGSTIISNYLMSASIPNIINPSAQPTYAYDDGTTTTIKTSEGTSILLMTYDLYKKYDPEKDKRFQKLVYNGLYDAEFTSTTPFAYRTTSNATFLPTTLKYYDHQNNYNGLSKYAAGTDNIVYRYADVLLMYAECLNETNNTAGAVTYLNLVRNRAGLDATTAASKEDLSMAIENERLLELCFEGHRWFDLLRIGRLNKIMTDHFNWAEPGLNSVIQSHMNGNDKIDSKATWKWANVTYPILFPLPYDQLQLMLDRGWTQNEGY
ncbi:MAG: carbohydrate-binding protein [Bacteroidetes bacterium GWD2_45_23]|nr:MAG: carbohydrate-binding protein [Bacteroidetes bacterium GWC2_46_850]OFX84089.1 MAG: carbohydrate-binding protein [Bacteroidetes bacterium GWD2_45_23]